MKRLLTLAFCGLGLLALSSTAQAAPITGEIHFAGLWNPTGGSGVATATGLDFSTSGFQIVLAGTGTYAGLTGTGVAFQDFTFTSFAGPLVPLWSFSSGGVDYSFALNSVAVAFQSGTQLDLTGSGVLHATGFDDIDADWDFTGNAGSVIFSFSADNVAVPEPATVGLLGLGLVGLTAAGKKRTRRSD
jgi:PEP-CTERM motif